MKGIVKSGLGKGAYYIGLDNYKNQIIEKLGFSPFLGTLNVESNGKENFIKNLKNIGILGDGNGSDCDTYLVKISANNKMCDGAIIIPKITDHDSNIVELISPDFLRESLNIGDGDKIEINEN